MSKKKHQASAPAGGGNVYGILVVAREGDAPADQRYFVVAASPDAARTRALAEFSEKYPSRDVRRAWATLVGRESDLVARDEKTQLKIGDLEVEYAWAGLLASIGPGSTPDRFESSTGRREVLR